MYRLQKAGKTGFRTTSQGWVSTYRLSHLAGQVINVFVPLTCCRAFGAQSNTVSFPEVATLYTTPQPSPLHVPVSPP